jgi:hypothetical protein
MVAGRFRNRAPKKRAADRVRAALPVIREMRIELEVAQKD